MKRLTFANKHRQREKTYPVLTRVDSSMLFALRSTLMVCAGALVLTLISQWGQPDLPGVSLVAHLVNRIIG